MLKVLSLHQSRLGEFESAESTATSLYCHMSHRGRAKSMLHAGLHVCFRKYNPAHNAHFAPLVVSEMMYSPTQSIY